MKIVAIDPLILSEEDRKQLQTLGEFIEYDTKPEDANDTVQRSKEADIIIDFWVALPAEVINQLSQTKLIVSASSGYDWIDVNAATKKGIAVAHCPGHNTESVAEYTIALILNSLRNTLIAAVDARNGNFEPESFQGSELSEKTLGVIGYGHIGKRVAEIAEKGFGANILYVNSKSSREDLEHLLKNSDIVSINAPINDHTRNMIGRKEFDLMKKGVVIVNTGRGAVVDETALHDNIKSGKVFAAGLDIMVQEPFDLKNPLFTLDNVIITPHIGYNTRETDQRLSKQVVEIVEAYINGKPVHIIPEQL